MNEIEYVLRILLRARDETAAAFKSARTELRLFVNAADDGAAKIDKFNKSMSTMEKNMDGVAKKMREWRTVIHGLGDDNDESAKSIAKVGKETDNYVKKTQQAVQTQAQLSKQARSLRDDVTKLSKAHEDEAVSADHATRRYKELGRQLENISEKMTDAQRIRTPAIKWAEDAKQAAQQIINANKAI